MNSASPISEHMHMIITYQSVVVVVVLDTHLPQELRPKNNSKIKMGRIEIYLGKLCSTI